MNFLSLQSDERVTSVLAVRPEEWEGEWSLSMVTKRGVVKKSDAQAFKDVRRSGLIAITLKEGDALIAARFVSEKDTVMLVTRQGQSIRFAATDVREMGRAASGVTGVKLGKKDRIVSVAILPEKPKDYEVLVVTEQGYGKTTDASDYKVQKRGGTGIKTAKLTAKTGEIVGSVVLSPDERADGELVVMSQKGQVIKLPLADVPNLGRQTQGVRVMKMRTDDAIATVVFV
jgi:DNA gyrase subunit A